MKKLIGFGIIVLMLFNIGCASTYNHYRVQNNKIESRVYASGDQQTIQLMNAGVRPRSAVQIRAAHSDRDGFQALLAVDAFNMGNWFNTFKESPLSTSLALVGDAIVLFGVGYAVDRYGFSSSSSSGDHTINQDSNGASYYYNVSGDNNTITTATINDDDDDD